MKRSAKRPGSTSLHIDSMIPVMGMLNTARSGCYRVARILGWVNAIGRGHVARHYARVRSYRFGFKLLRKVIK